MYSTEPPTAARLSLVDGLVLLSELVQKVFSDTADAHGLRPLQARLLGVLRGRRPSMTELGRLLGLDTSSTTGLVDRAARRGLVRRVTDPKDGRSYLVEFTAEGRRVAAELVADVTAGLSEFTGCFDGEERNLLTALVSDLVIRNAATHGRDLGAELEGAVP